ncbi:hypothetical protein LCGC14_1132430 [marine sediment metagenome]|uniref:Uncharacterized protein n=1 Tax=marine sediment metagenome TaxID=412755 RepID=A0A0F9M5L5_9ZZZZ|nr:MAG: hypothetical protein Lokiarch_06910 [Candidatus Lokiarchaeum sp. GC14_75]
MGVGRFIAIIGGVLGVLSMVLFYFLPEIFNLWRFVDEGSNVFIYIGGFGSWYLDAGFNFGIRFNEDIFLLIVSLLIVGGSMLTIIAGVKGSKILGILGGVILLAGPALFILEIITKIGIIGEILGLIPALGSFNLLFGNFSGAVWGFWISSFLTIGGGILGIVGGATS